MRTPKITIHNHLPKARDASGSVASLMARPVVAAYYNGEPGDPLDRKVREAYGRFYSNGGAISGNKRDASGSVPADEVSGVVARLRALPGVKVKVFVVNRLGLHLKRP